MTDAAKEDAAFTRLMDDLQVIYGAKAGHVLTQEDVDALNRLDEYWREDAEHAVETYHQGYQHGLAKGAEADTAALVNRTEKAVSDLQIERSLSKFHSATGATRFRDGAAACREMMAAFVEQGGDPVTANSIRLNWNPEWGDDPAKVTP